MASTVNEAGSLLRYILTAGQLLVHRDGARGLVELGELAVLLSIGFEAKRGVDVQAKYGDCGELGPDSTHYGVAILAAFDNCDIDLHWRECLEARGLTVEHFWLEDAAPLDYTLDFGQSFSRHAAVGTAKAEEPASAFPVPPSIPGLIPPSRLRPTHSRSYVRV
jgi:hypothetical protein